MKRAADRESRAETFFLVHKHLGPGRTLRLLHEQLQASGFKLSLQTLKSYSSDYDWVARAARFDAEAQQQAEVRALRTATESQERHRQIANAAIGGAAKALGLLISNEGRLAEMGTVEIVRLLSFGIEADAALNGAVRDREAIAIHIWNALMLDVVELFRDCNRLPEPEDRAAAFGRGFDAIRDELLHAVAKE
jgi:hypothetical protein